MNKKTLKKYQKNKKEIEILEFGIDNLRNELDSLPTQSSKVVATSESYPYIQQHISVEGYDPAEYERLTTKIKEKEDRISLLEEECSQVETYVESREEGLYKQILYMVYIQGESQEVVAEKIGYTQGRISQILKD